MLFTKTAILATAATLAEVVSAVGHARVYNKCPFDVTVWSVGSSVSKAYTLHQNVIYSETFSRDAKTGGRALKITREDDGLYTAKPQTDFSYSLEGDVIWYDLSDVFGDPFKGHKVVEASANGDCPKIVWNSGVPPSGSQVKNCGSDKDVTLTLCD